MTVNRIEKVSTLFGSPCWSYTETKASKEPPTVGVPVIASGGAGCLAHIAEALDEGPQGGHASAALLASLLHDGVLTVEEIKGDLIKRGLRIRP